MSGTLADTLGEANPLTYRGYVYDHDSGYFYLQSRYYDPEMGRFINGDGLVSTGQDVLGCNAFCYCLNNPNMGTDPTGESALLTLAFMGVGAVVNIATSCIGALSTGQSIAISDIIVAGASGAFCALGGMGSLLGGLISGAYSAINSANNGASWQGSLLTGFVSGILTTFSIGNLAGLAKNWGTLAIQAFVDLVFGTGYNTMAAATYKAVTSDSPSKEGDIHVGNSVDDSHNIQSADSVPSGSTNCSGRSPIRGRTPVIVHYFM